MSSPQDVPDRAQRQASLMGRIFALRHLTLASGVLAAGLIVALGKLWLPPNQAALVVLFGIFYLLVSLMLYWIRVGVRDRLLLLLPAGALLLPAGRGQLLGVWLGTMVFLDAFAGPSQSSSSQLPFRVAQGLVLASALLAFAPVSSLLALGGGAALLATAGFAVGCWRWQDRLKLELSEMD